MRSLVALGLALSFSSAASAAVIRPEVVRTLPHDASAFTQGLVFHEGRLLESTGLRGRSSLRLVVPETGAVERRVDVASDLFGEGLALVGSELVQLTWQERVALRYDLDFTPRGTFAYEGEGWGLCYDGTRLVMSDGSSRLTFRDPKTFAAIGSVVVTSDGVPLKNLNELECVGSLVYANVWQTDTIVRIEAASGRVLTRVDASGLLSPAEAARADVLNGIAFDAKSGHFFLTGKLWPKLFEVRFPFDPGAPEGVPASSVTPPGAVTTSARPRTADTGAAAAASAHSNGGSVAPARVSPSSCGCRTESASRDSVTWWSSAALGLVWYARNRRAACVHRRR